MQLLPHDKVDIDYIHQDAIGGVIALGLAELYMKRPDKPIEYLAKWLLDYEQNQEKQKQFEQEQQNKSRLKEKWLKDQKHKEFMQKQEIKLQEAKQKKEDDFRDKIKTSQYHEDILIEFCNHLQKNLTGMYICEMLLQTKEVDLFQNDEPNSHLLRKQPSKLKYVATSDQHQYLMNQWLDESLLTNDALKEETFGIIYIPDVIKNKKLHFYKWPQLGAYMAIPVIYHSCLNEEAFDSALANRLEYKRQQEEQKQLLEQFECEDQENYEQEFEKFKESLPLIEEAPFKYTKYQLIICCDTLSQDREFSAEERKQIEEYARLLGESWENMHKQLLSQDVDDQIAYFGQHNTSEEIDKYNLEEQQYVDQQMKEQEEYFSKLKGENEEEYLYEIECLKLNFLKNQLRSDELANQFLNLTNRRIIKFEGVIQAAFYLLNYEKQEINIEGTNNLNWKVVKQLIHKDWLDFLLDYSHRGSKKVEPHPWGLIERVQRRLDRYQQEDIDDYCLGFGRIYLLLQRYCTLRKQDSIIRRKKYEQRFQDIEDAKQAIIEFEAEKERQLQECKDNLEEDQEFDEESWLREFNEKYKIPIIPEEPEEEIDLDFEQTN